jgi:hypothetical protein
MSIETVVYEVVDSPAAQLNDNSSIAIQEQSQKSDTNCAYVPDEENE